jgi:gliding motility-associated-like protein
MCYAQIPTQNLEGYWPFHGNPQDSSGNFNNGIVNNAVLTQDRFGNCNEAYRFNGINSHIVIPNSTSIDMNNSTDFSVSLWIKVHVNNYGSWSGYVIFANTTNSGYCNSPGHVSFYSASGFAQDACSDNVLDSNWHHVTGVYKYLSNQGFLYVDGVLQSDIGQSSGGLSTVSDLIFGDNTHFNEPFMGSLDAIRIYRKALNSSEVLQLYHEGNPGSVVSGINVIEDTVICSSNSYNINASQANADSYLWSNGSVGSSISVQNSGIYWVDMSINGCIARDSAKIQITSVANINLVKDTIICSDPVVLRILDTTLNVTWWNGSHASQTIVNSSGIYYVETQIDGCIYSDSISVSEYSQNFNGLIPNVITPNGDGVNDVFEFKSEDFTVQEFYLYNRWGKLIYSNTNNTVRWDGKQSNSEIDDRTYFWTFKYVNNCSKSNKIIQNKGFLTVFK